MPKVRPEDMDLDSGLADDFDSVILDAYFGVKADYDAVVGTSVPMLILCHENPNDPAKPFEQAYSLGAAKQWAIVKDGKEVVSDKSPDSHKFNMNSRAGEVVGRLFELAGKGNKGEGQKVFVGRDYYMTESSFYIGADCHWKREKRSTVGGGTSDVLLPTEFRGFKTVATGTAGKASPKAAGKAVAVEASEQDTEIITKLAEGKDERGLKQACLKEFKGRNDLLNLIINKGLLAELEKDGKLVKGPDGRFV
jgi:hypothetical protein